MSNLGPVEAVVTFTAPKPLNDEALGLFRSHGGKILLVGLGGRTYIFTRRFDPKSSGLEQLITNLTHSIRGIVELAGKQDSEKVEFIGLSVKRVSKVKEFGE